MGREKPAGRGPLMKRLLPPPLSCPSDTPDLDTDTPDSDSDMPVLDTTDSDSDTDFLPSPSPSPRSPTLRCPPTCPSPSSRRSTWPLLATTEPDGPSPAHNFSTFSSSRQFLDCLRRREQFFFHFLTIDLRYSPR